MLLAIDIGNTNITIGIFDKEKLLCKDSLAADNPGQFGRFLKGAFRRRHINLSALKAAAISSVVPGINLKIQKEISRLLNIPVYFIGKDLKVPIRNLYRKPQQAGQDRLAGAYAALEFYGAPVIVVDLGTALTLDVVSLNREYLGGIILPGLKLSLSALHRYTALLPEIRLSMPEAVIGRDTRGSMLSGISFGFGSLIDGLVVKLKKESRARKAKIVATGGDCLFIKPYCQKIDYYHPDLILEGILKIVEYYKKF